MRRMVHWTRRLWLVAFTLSTALTPIVIGALTLNLTMLPRGSLRRACSTFMVVVLWWFVD